MADLREQMLKAGLISEEQAKRAAHKQRVDKKRSDPKERVRESETRREAVRQEQEAERARHREQGRRQAEDKRDREQSAADRQRRDTALEAAYREGALQNWEGPRRYYYAAHGRVDWLTVTEDAARKLEGGQAAICAAERNQQRHILLNAAAARKLTDIAPERVLVWHRQ